MIGRQLLHYRIVDRAGSGSMGEVYKAEDDRLKRPVALKMLPEELASDQDRLERFQHEAEVLAQLDHPNIVTIYSVDEAEGRKFLTMGWVEGQTLEQALSERGFLLEGLFDIAIPLAEAVAAAHDKGITHRDLKPANIMLTAEGTVKVLDFGLARSGLTAHGLASDAQTLTGEGMLVGSLPYMSPEQVRGEPADPRSDVFALGAILYEIATGERPFGGATPSDLISSILRDSPPPVDQLRQELPHHLGRIVRRCLHKDPDRRYESAKGLRNALADLRTEAARTQPDVRTIAVLPFVDMSPERDQGYFCEGVAEEILNALSSLESLCVAARASSFQFRDAPLDLREIGARLGVGAILDGSVRKAGSRLRITAQLINVADGYHLWSERYDRELEDVFAIQDEIAENVVEALKLTLSPQQKESLKKPTAKIEAYDYYLRGRHLMEEIVESGFQSALGMFEKAVAIDPKYAPAWAGIADSHSWLFAWYGSCGDDLDEADRVSRRAVELAPDSAEARASRGYVLSLRGQHADAAFEFERAIALNPRLFEAYWYYGRDRFGQGDNEHAARLMEKAAAVRPDDYQALLLQAQFYRSLNEPGKARAAAERSLERARRRLELNPREARALYLGAGALLLLGRRDEGLDWAERALALGPDEPTILYNVGCSFAVAGETDRALACLEKALAEHFGLREWFEHDSDLDSLRSHPRFQALLDSYDAEDPCPPS
jgi:non-specific serine/threonine protein kinase